MIAPESPHGPRTLQELAQILRDAADVPADQLAAYAAQYGLPYQYDMIDLTDLPTYGGTPPADRSWVLSWDETHLLVGYGAGSRKLAIVPRAEAWGVRLNGMWRAIVAPGPAQAINYALVRLARPGDDWNADRPLALRLKRLDDGKIWDLELQLSGNDCGHDQWSPLPLPHNVDRDREVDVCRQCGQMRVTPQQPTAAD